MVSRLVNIGLVNIKDALSYGFTGVLLRGSGLSWIYVILILIQMVMIYLI